MSLLALGLAGCESRQLHLLDADTSTWEDYRGRWVVMNYWAEWCKPCREEMPELNRLASLFRQPVAVLGVHYDQPAEDELRRQVALMGVEFPVLTRDPSAMLGYPRPSVLPTTLIFDASGELQYTLVGPQRFDSLRQRLKLTLAPDLHPGDGGGVTP